MKFHVKVVCVLAAAAAVLPAPVMASAKDTGTSHSADQEPRNAEAIARLIAVWGFVKYHHNDARDGLMPMDKAFFELYPQVASAGSLEDADAVIAAWLDAIGYGEPCDPCVDDAMPSADQIAIVRPTNAWIATLPEALALRVKAVFNNRSAAAGNFFVQTAPVIGNPLFSNEPDYSNTSRVDDEAMHLLTLARQWNLLRYWFPYRDVMDTDPHALLEGALDEFLTAETPEDRQRARLRFAAESDDGHVNIAAYRKAGSPIGECMSPHGWQFVEGKLVLDGRGIEGHEQLRPGDVVTKLDGVEVVDLAQEYGAMIAASNSAWRERMLAATLARGVCATRQITATRGEEAFEVAVDWTAQGASASPDFGRAGKTIQKLEDTVTYVKFDQLKRDQLPELVEVANAGTGLVLDMRGYVSDFLVFALGQYLVDEPTEFAVFTRADVATPGQFVWGQTMTLNPDPDGQRLTVPVVAIVNAATVSSPEYHAMAYRAGGVTIVGSTTAGADGNVSSYPLPDGAGMRFSGIGVYYPDLTPTQRVGIVPDVMVKPTIAGIAAGRDEQLEGALAYLKAQTAG